MREAAIRKEAGELAIWLDVTDRRTRTGSVTQHPNEKTLASQVWILDVPSDFSSIAYGKGCPKERLA